MLLKMGRTLYEDMGRMEELVRAGGLDWTIIRPAGLFDTTDPTEYIVGKPRTPGRFTARKDLADALVRSAVDHRDADEIVEVITTKWRAQLRQRLREGSPAHRQQALTSC